jgi:tetratricopeptide (TPR) repeat protein
MIPCHDRVKGTPAYMSPEQARGDVRHIDRRSDVYGLGATLYDLLSGKPPFEDETVVNLLLKVVDATPRPLRTIDPTIPAALELIVATCLHKEPSQRYASALALAEDLERFLSSQRVVARKLSLRYRIRYFARRNRLVTGLGVALVVSLLGFVGYGVRSAVVQAKKEALAQQRAALERQLGQDLKEIEWLLRAAYELPLHDTALEQSLVMRRMTAMADKLHQLPGESVAPVHRALGLGRLALHEVEAAIAELLQAQQAGDESAELHYALGRARGALFQKRLEEARRSGEHTWVEKRRRELQAELLVPAVASLEQSRGLDLQAPEYLQGLIALYRDQLDEALALADKAKQKAPWLYEAEELAGDAHLARGLAAKAGGQADAARASLERALAHYQAAIAIGRSAGHLYEKAAEVLLRQSEIDRERGKPVVPQLEEARKLADHAITAAPRRGSGYTKKAYALFHLSCAYLGTDQSPEALGKQLVQVGDQALAIDPRDGYALDAVGSGLGCLGSYEQAKGRSPLPTWKDALARLRRAAEVMPHFPWAYNDYGTVLVNYLEETAKREELKEAEVATAEQWILKATELDPAYAFPLSNLARLYWVFATNQLGHGQNLQSSAARAIEYARRALAKDPQLQNASFAIAAAYLLQAEFALWSGADPVTFTKQATAVAEERLNQNPKAPDLYWLREQAYWIEAEALLRQHRQPEPAIVQGQREAQRCHDLHPPFPDCYLTEVQLLLTQAASLRSQGRAVDKTIAQAWERLERATAIAKDTFDLRVLRAEVRLWRNRPQDLQDFDDALTDVQQALVLQPRAALPLALRGKILLAKGLRISGKQRQLAEVQAEESLREATKRNPLLAGRYAAEIAQAKRLAERSP